VSGTFLSLPAEQAAQQTCHTFLTILAESNCSWEGVQVAHCLGKGIFNWHNIFSWPLKACYVLQLSHAHCDQS